MIWPAGNWRAMIKLFLGVHLGLAALHVGSVFGVGVSVGVLFVVVTVTGQSFWCAYSIWTRHRMTIEELADRSSI